MIKKITLFFLSIFASTCIAQNVIRVLPEGGDMTVKIQKAIEKARSYNGKRVLIELQNANYHIYIETVPHKSYIIFLIRHPRKRTQTRLNILVYG